MGDKTPASLTFPLTTVEDVVKYLATLKGDVEIVAYEFSGAMGKARAKMGAQVFVVDRRDPEHDLPSYKGDVRDVIGLRLWSVGWFLGPNCFQHMRRDDNSAQKLGDGRAFFGVAEVEWCLDCPHVRALVMEQPDTIAHDYIDMSERRATQVIEFRTAWLGDARDKFVRLTLRNVILPPLKGMMTRSNRHLGNGPVVTMEDNQPYQRPKHTAYASADERDRDRSTWLPLTKTTNWVASFTFSDGKTPAPDEYVRRIRALGGRWKDAGHYLPPDYDRADAQPASQEDRAYQQVRGAGRGPGAGRSKPARRAEPGDQRMSNADSAFLTTVARRAQEGAALTTGQTAKLAQMAAAECVEGPLFFWSEKLTAGMKGCLSNYFTSDFHDDALMNHRQRFSSVEQYMHWAKAMIAGDYHTADLIKQASDPAECKRLGRLVRGHDDLAWAATARLVVERATYLKFDQNKVVGEFLLSTGRKELVEASPHDRRWGIGFTEAKAVQVPKEEWGTNWLGQTLVITRLRLRLGNAPAVPYRLTQAIDHRRTHGGGAPKARAQPTVVVAESGATGPTPRGHVSMAPLSTAMRALVPILAPGYIIVDRGAKGACGPNSLSYVAWLAGLVDKDDGLDFRAKICDYAEKLLRTKAVLQLDRRGEDNMPIRTLLTNALRAWAPAGMHVSAERWIAAMRCPHVWADHAFLKLAADMLQAEVKYYSVRSGRGLCHVDSLMPSNNAAPKACLRLALELEVHFCAIVDVEAPTTESSVRGGDALSAGWEAAWGDPHGEAANAMVPTASQWLMLLEHSVELARERNVATVTAEEFEAMIEAISKSQVEAPTASVVAALRESLETLRQEEDRRLQEGIRRSMAQARSIVVGGADLVLEDDDLAEPTDEEMTGGGGRSPRAPAFTLRPTTQDEVDASTLLVVPYTLREGEPMVLMPSAEGAVLALPGGAREGDVVAKAERAVEQALEPSKTVVGFTAGRHEGGARLTVVATDDDTLPVARTAQALRRISRAGVALVWCTLAALTAPTWTMQVAGVAVAAASHFMAHDGTTSWMLQGESHWRHATGLQPGRSPMQAPPRPVLPTGDITPRMLLQSVAGGLEELKSACRGKCLDHYNEWADAIKPLNVAEVAPEMLDQAIGVMSEALGSHLFSEPLPVYETPWLNRAPDQRWEARPGCQDYVAHTALDLVDEQAKRDLRTWFRAAQKDALCLEEKGAECDRRDKPPTIAIGQDQVHPCAQGYVWDCRQRPCRLLDYSAAIDTDWDMDYLIPKLKDYPDQRLRSNVVEGIRLESDPELMALFSPQLVSIGIGYGSVQKTVRELKELGFYEFFEALPFWPVIIVGQGSRIKKLGVQKYRRTSNFSGPHKLVLDKKGRRAVPINEGSRCYLIPEWLAKHRDERVCAWAKDKYAHVPPPADGKEPSPRHKFPKERKPQLGEVMKDLAILLHASLLLG